MINQHVSQHANSIISLNELGILTLQGLDAKKLLQGQVTCDMEEISLAQTRLGTHCNPKGRVIFSFQVIQRDDSYHLLLPHTMLDIAKQALQKYAVFYKTQLQINQQQSCLGLYGNDILQLLKTVNYPAPENINQVTCYPEFSIMRVLNAEHPRCIIVGQTEPIRILLQQAGCEPMSFQVWQQLLINAGIPLIYPETSGLFTPHQINYQLVNGISFTKGCYTGQEIIARMEHLGKLKQHMYQGIIKAGASPTLGGDILAGDKIAGQLVNAVLLENNHYAALFTLFDNYAASLDLTLAAQASKITQIQLPAYFSNH